MNKKISISILTIMMIASIHKIETKTYGYSKSDCKKHHKEWQNGKCRDKRKRLPQVEKIKNQIAQSGSITGSILQNQASDITVIFYDKIGGTALTNSDLPKNILASGATVNIPTGATYLKVGPDTQDFDTAQMAATGLSSNTQYVIGADINGNLAIGVSSNIAAPAAAQSANQDSINPTPSATNDSSLMSQTDEGINDIGSSTDFTNSDNTTFDFSSSF